MSGSIPGAISVGRIPRLSFGLPVRNSEHGAKRCLESLLTQSFDDFEIVIGDNASDDRTLGILQEFAARDDRIHLHENREDIGLIENFNLVFRHSRGEFFRWVGADDWLEPEYAASCVAALEADPGAIVATSYFQTHYDDGRVICEEFRGEMLESDDPARRFERMLWFVRANDVFYDPVYSLFRRDALEKSGLIRMMESADRILSAELALVGRFVHVPRCLAHRTRAYETLVDREMLMRRYHPTRWREIPSSARRIHRTLLGLVEAASLDRAQRRRCRVAAHRYYLRDGSARLSRDLARRRRNLGLNRRKLESLFPWLRGPK